MTICTSFFTMYLTYAIMFSPITCHKFYEFALASFMFVTVSFSVFELIFLKQ
jgi:hypothetical protein